MAIEIGVKTKERPRLEDLEVNDTLHISTENMEDMLVVFKGSPNEYLMKQKGGHPILYHKININRTINLLAERYDLIYMVTREENK
ncbi:MAG TPA: hypothetical protein EYP22_09880 [Methanosarcinales archaeon]|nr:hypothetical protein [Methanosarcinales archaeon]